MAEIELTYLWFANGRNARYPFYRRDDQRIPLTAPDGRRLKQPKHCEPKVVPPEVVEAYLRVHANFSQPVEEQTHMRKPGSIGHGIAVYKGSADYTGKRARTKKEYGRALDWLDATHGHRMWGDFPREAVLQIRDDHAATPSSANFLIDVIGILGNFVGDRPKTFRLPQGWQNPASRIKPLPTGNGHVPWEEDQIEQFRAGWNRVCLERVLFEDFLGTGQRGGDVIKMERTDYRLGEIIVRQEKTDEQVLIPAADDFKEVLEPWLASHPYEPFFPAAGGRRPISGSYMRTVMRNAIRKAGLPDTCTLHGLRYTFATRAIEAGLDYQTIESIVGHTTMEMAYKYTEKRRRSRLAVATLNIALKVDREHRAAREPLASSPVDRG